MNIRQLPFEEWDKLEGFPILANGYPDPNTTVILVAETLSGQIVGTWSAVTPVYLEGLWIDPEHRNSTVAGRLLIAMEAFLKSININKAYTLVQTPEVLALAKKAGFEEIEGNLCVLTLQDNN